MKSYTTTTLGIAFKIWFIALLINTIADTILINGFSGDVTEVFLLIGLFGGLFSAPIFLIIWGMLYSLLKAGKSAGYILTCLFIAGISMAIVAWAVFTGSFRLLNGEFHLVLAAPLAGAIAIGMAYSNIKNACLSRDEEKNFPKNIQIPQISDY